MTPLRHLTHTLTTQLIVLIPTLHQLRLTSHTTISLIHHLLLHPTLPLSPSFHTIKHISLHLKLVALQVLLYSVWVQIGVELAFLGVLHELEVVLLEVGVGEPTDLVPRGAIRIKFIF